MSIHLQTAVKQGGSTQVLYVSGMPGTGKTASVMEAVKQMGGNKSIPPFVFARVNSMRLDTPRVVFNSIHQQIQFGNCAIHTAHAKLMSFFSTRGERDPVVLLLIDEIDYLVQPPLTHPFFRVDIATKWVPYYKIWTILQDTLFNDSSTSRYTPALLKQAKHCVSWVLLQIAFVCFCSTLSDGTVM